ncbi:hypothetical protein ACSBR2_022488 [Camellia fascicularis]
MTNLMFLEVLNLSYNQLAGKIPQGRHWKVVVMGYGYGFVFRMVMGYLMFVTRKPKWLIKIIEGKQYKKLKRSKKGAH